MENKERTLSWRVGGVLVAFVLIIIFYYFAILRFLSNVGQFVRSTEFLVGFICGLLVVVFGYLLISQKMKYFP